MPKARKARGPVLEGRVRDVTQAGESVIETEQGVVLAHAGLPGEKVRLALEGKRAGVLRGEVLSILERSAERVDSPCSLSERCGGCPLMTLSEPAQASLKLARAQRAIEGLCMEGTVMRWEAPGPALAYRRRVRLSFHSTQAGAVLGYRAQASHHIVDVPSCVVLEAVLGQALGLVRQRLGSVLGGNGEIELVKATEGSVSVEVSCDTPLPASAYRAAEELASQPGIRGVSLRVEGGARAHFGLTDQVSIALDGLPLSAPASSFAQANAVVNDRLTRLVTELAEPEGARVVELYAGHGNFTIGLAQQAASLTAFEIDDKAAGACRDNLRARGNKNARVHAGDAADAIKGRGPADVIVLDPPRSGAPQLGEITARYKPKRVVYVSCHMTTLGRDLRVLFGQGYRVDRAHALDMFPHTAHVEAVVRMRLQP